MIVDEDNRKHAKSIATRFQRALQEALVSNRTLKEGILPSVIYRIKDERSSAGKLERRYEHGLNQNLNDFIGFRILLCHRDQINPAVAIVRKWAAVRNLTELHFDDPSTDLSKRPYRSTHIDFDLPGIYSVDCRTSLGVEVQITTHFSNAISEISHSVAYEHGKTSHKNASQVDLLNLLYSQTDAIERAVSYLFGVERKTPHKD